MNWFLRLTIIPLLVLTACLSNKADTPETRNQQASLELARQMVGHGEYQRAIQFLSPRSRGEDVSAEVHLLIGLSFIGLNNPEAAMKSFSTALRIESKNDDARLNLAYTKILLGRYSESRALLDEILQRGKYPYPERVHLNIGLAFLQEKHCDKAIPEFQAALDIDPTYSVSYFNLGKCQLNAGRLGEARASFQRAVDFCPGCHEPQLELAAVAFRLGDRQNALSQLDTILKAKPEPSIEKRALALRKQVTR